MPALETSGTQTATIGTEHTLATLTTVKVFSPYVDLANMAAGDVVELRAKTKCLTGGVTRTIHTSIYRDAALTDDSIATLPPVISDQEYVVTLKQTAGTGRAFPWKIMSA